ncbi:hypothetical protein AVEN_11122-1 [Araneus ventricosus]|uniref:Uncharacterized protein n=1 Tax=Araneus ventricosus TaxID=182803 RepID=A0A4Y2JK27_ARAVE|nr:hypothetical protein AVEN_11122-1 [Araneus ventricosus]
MSNQAALRVHHCRIWSIPIKAARNGGSHLDVPSRRHVPQCSRPDVNRAARTAIAPMSSRRHRTTGGSRGVIRGGTGPPVALSAPSSPSGAYRWLALRCPIRRRVPPVAHLDVPSGGTYHR